MKSLITSIALLFVTLNVFATVWMVDNNSNRPSSANIFATFAEAHTAATAGDTILVIPSTASYGAVNISKGIVVLGIGFNPDKDSQLKSNFTSITINNGVSDVTISGIVASAISIGHNSAASTQSNILIEKCNLNYVQNSSTIQNLTNILIRQNFIQLLNNGTVQFYFRASTQSNIIISNNIFSFVGTSAYGPWVTTGGVIFDHNTFVGTSNGQTAFYQLVSCMVSNNIFYGKALSSTSATSSAVTFLNNLVFGLTDNSIISGSGFTLTGNLESADPLFVNMAEIGPYDFAKDFALNTGSPAINAGSDGTDLGIYGGSTPYKNSGVSLPVVKTLILPTTIRQGTNTNANISVNGN